MAYVDVTRHYRYSYSGSDARAWAYFPNVGDRPVQIESLHTISWSAHDAKAPARSLGFANVRGFTRAVRTIAGSLIVTVIEDNPLAALMDLAAELANDARLHWPGWMIDKHLNGIGSGIDNTAFTRRLAATLPPINILVQYVAEGSTWVRDDNDPNINIIPGAAYLLLGVELMDEGLVTSTSDSASEMTYSFMARDCKTLSKQQFETFIANPFTPYNEIMTMEQALRYAILSEQNSKKLLFQQQTNEAFGGRVGAEEAFV